MTLQTLALLVLLSATAAAQVRLDTVDGRPGALAGDTPLIAFDTLWVADGGWQGVYRFPNDAPGEAQAIDGGRRTVRVSEGDHGRVVQTVDETEDSIRVRYDFDFAAIPDAEHIQWVLRLEPERFDGATVAAEGGTDLAPRPIEEAHAEGIERLSILLPGYDLDFAVDAADGVWSFHDRRSADWARCYRLAYDRPFARDGSRTGWVEMKLTVRDVSDLAVPLTAGEEASVGGLPVRLGAPLADVGQPLAAIAFWHTAAGPAQRGGTVGEVEVLGQDGPIATVPFRWEQEATSPDDDPRDLPGGALKPLPDGTPAWLTVWTNPDSDRPVSGIRATAHAAGWRLAGATGLSADATPERAAAFAGLGRSGGPVPEESVLSLDGTWNYETPGGATGTIEVPRRWDGVRGLRGEHVLTYSRRFDLPAGFTGRHILLRFDAIGEFGEVWVNGLYAGEALAGPLPVEFDITGLVSVPSEDNELTVRVKDDTHFSVPRATSDWRNRRHWIPHGIGGNNRKGLFQHVTVRARPPMHIRDVHIRTSVRERRLTAVYEIFNSGRLPVTAELGATVRPRQGGDVELAIPPRAVELPGQVVTTVELSAPWENPRLWQPNHPHLYSLRSILTEAGGPRLHRREDRFGFREVWFDGIHFYLNGIRCNLRGESPSYAQNEGPFERRETTEEAVRRSLGANFNVLRFHAAPAPPHVYDVCDELGMMVIDESAIYASWGMIMPEHPRWLPECRRHLERWVRRDRNHPSIVLWSAENEGLNVSRLSPEQLGAFKRVIDANDGTRPVIFDGDGSGFGISPASCKHYVGAIADLRHQGGQSSGYGRDLRNDIYWAAEFEQDFPLGIGEFLYPATDRMRRRRVEVCAMMGLQTRGYRYADWFDIRPYNPFYTGYQSPDGVREGYEEAWDLIVKSFAAVAVFDKAYDELGAFPDPPVLDVGQAVTRTLIVYNDTFEGEDVTVRWEAVLDGRRIAGESRELQIGLGDHVEFEIEFTPDRAGGLELRLSSEKAGAVQFEDTREFTVR